MSKDMRKEGKLVKSSDILGNPGRGLMAGTCFVDLFSLFHKHNMIH